MSATLVASRTRRGAGIRSETVVEARGLRRSLRAALRAGRTPRQISGESGVPTRTILVILGGRAHLVSSIVAERLLAVLTPCDVVVHDLPLRDGHVPVGIVQPIVDDAVERLGMEGAADRCGVHSRRLLAIRQGQMLTVQFGVADRIVSFLAPGGPFAWRSDPTLRRWYWNSVVTSG